MLLPLGGNNKTARVVVYPCICGQSVLPGCRTIAGKSKTAQHTHTRTHTQANTYLPHTFSSPPREQLNAIELESIHWAGVHILHT